MWLGAQSDFRMWKAIFNLPFFFLVFSRTFLPFQTGRVPYSEFRLFVLILSSPVAFLIEANNMLSVSIPGVPLSRHTRLLWDVCRLEVVTIYLVLYYVLTGYELLLRASL